MIVDLDEWKVDFTELPPQRLICSTCSRVFRDPRVTGCCQKTYCFKCIEKYEGNECSGCGDKELEISKDETAQQSVNELYVRCRHVAIGCMWFGKLEALTKHLDLRLKEGQGGCVFVTVPCPNECGGKYTKKTLRDHLTGRCAKRQYNCEFCGKYSETYETVETEHFPVCPQYPVMCPNKCPQVKVARSKLDFHLKNLCEHQDNVVCAMEFAGCHEKLLRRNMHTHLQKNLTDHMILLGKMFDSYKQTVSDQFESLPTSLANPTQNGVKNDDSANSQPIDHNVVEILEAKDTEIKKIKAELHRLQKDKEDQNNSMLMIIDGLRRSLERQEERLIASEENNLNFTKEISRLRLFLPSPLPLTYTIGKYEQLKQANKWWYSRPFYSHYCGYKFGMFVFCNGVLDGKDSHISVFLYLVRGEYDDELEWPFKGSITVQLLNQRSDRGHHQKVIKFTDETPPSVSSRLLDVEMAKEGNGPTQFISHADLSYNSEKDTEFIRDDSLKIRVSSISVKGHLSQTQSSKGTDTLPRRASQNSRAQLVKISSVDSRQGAPDSPKFLPKSPSSGEVSPLVSPNLDKDCDKVLKESDDKVVTVNL